MAKHLVINAETSTAEYVDLTPEEEAAATERDLAHTEAIRTEAERQALLESLRPDEKTLAAIKDGTPLTSAEMESAVRWLILREVAG